MAFSITTGHAATAYDETLWLMRSAGIREKTRNGDVITLPDPFVLTINEPSQRIIRCPVRNANPFFHVMETVWMFAGRKDAAWLLPFNKNYDQFADDGIIHGAYGHRWLRQWGNQIRTVVERLAVEPSTRQAVISMWDPMTDNMKVWKDRPCNTHIYFRLNKYGLDMTVCNRSNDLIWGMFGANIVHMTYLHELVAKAACLDVGRYHVMTNNLHFYPDLYPNAKAIWDNRVEGPNAWVNSVPILDHSTEFEHFFLECGLFCDGDFHRISNPWLKGVAKPMRDAYLAKTKEARLAHASIIMDDGWELACKEWLERNAK